jgi:hypothetical protein
VQSLTENPTLFANEYGSKNPGQIGWIRKIEERQNTLRLHFEMQRDFPTIPPAKLEELVWELDFGQLEHYRTHMAVKDVDLMSVLTTAGIIKKEQKKESSGGHNEEGPDHIQVAPDVFKIPSTKQNSKLAAVMMPFAKQYDNVHVTLKKACAVQELLSNGSITSGRRTPSSMIFSH